MKNLSRNMFYWPVLVIISWLTVLNWVWGKIGWNGMAWGIPISLLLTCPIVWIFFWLKTRAYGKTGLLLSAFAWGASVAGLLSIVSQEVMQGFIDTHIGKDFGRWFGPLIITPVTEELFKGIFLLWLLRYRAEQIRCLLDGIVFGGLIGAGFAFSEQIMYFGQIVMRYLTRDPSDGVALFMLAASFILRGVMVPLMHPFLVAMAGLGVAAASTTQNRLLRYFLAAIGFLAAIALHGIWDWAGLASDDRYLIYKIYAGVMFPLFLAIVTFAIRLRNRRAREFYPITSGRRMPA